MSFFLELRRRNVFRVAGTYAVVAWLLIQVSSAVATPLQLPPWFEAFIIMLLAIGFPVALVLAWAFEITPDGIKLTQAQPSKATSRSNWLDYVLVGALLLIGAATVWDHLPSSPVDGSSGTSTLMDNPSIAVMPFDDMSSGKDQEYFGDGIAEELLNVLTRLDGLRVAGRSSSFAYRGKAGDLRKIGQELNVKAILEGSVRKDGDRIRITAQLINAEDGYHLWSDVFDRKMTDIFAIQEEIAREVAGALGVRLGVGNVNAFVGAGTKNVDAYEAYLQGREFWNRQDESIRLLEKAIQLDPNYSAAWAGLGVTTASLQWISSPEDAAAIMERAYGYALRAVELDPTSGQSLSQLATILYARFDWIAAEDAYVRAVALRADREILGRYGNMLMRAGRWQAAEVQYDAGRRAEPLGGMPYATSWMFQMAAGRFDEARRQLAISNPERDQDGAQLIIALSEGDRGGIKTLLASFPPMAASTRALYGPVLRDFDSPEKVLTTLRTVYADKGISWPGKYHDIALLAAYFGDAGFALTSMGNEARLTVVRLATLWYPIMSDVRRLPAFKDLVRDIKLVDYWRANGWADVCRPSGADDFICE